MSSSSILSTGMLKLCIAPLGSTFPASELCGVKMVVATGKEYVHTFKRCLQTHWRTSNVPFRF